MSKKRRPQRVEKPIRIVGGKFGGRKLHFYGAPGTKPMKQRVREAIFNLLGPAVQGKHVLDLFAGTGAMGLEALSRGAGRATLVEQHFPTVELIRRNVADLGVEDLCDVVAADTFIWVRRRLFDLASHPEAWLVFCSPPYAFYVDRKDEMLWLIEAMVRESPDGSLFVVEADRRFDFSLVQKQNTWDVRKYPPAVVGIHRKNLQTS